MNRYPDWLGDLGKRDEAMRAAHGLLPARDGWYKTVAGKKRYIAKPMPLADVLAVLPKRVEQIVDGNPDRPVDLHSPTLTLGELAAAFVAHLWQRHQTGSPRKLGRRTYDDYADTVARFVLAVGADRPAAEAGPAWFSRFARTIAGKAATTRQRQVIYVTAFFNWAGPGRESHSVYREPVRFGPDFAKPDARSLQASIDAGSTLYTTDDLNAALLAVADCPLLLAAGLLGLNCAFLPGDLTALPLAVVDLDGGMVDFARVKNGGRRKAALHPDTVFAIRSYLAVRPATDAPNLFVRDNGRPWNRRVKPATAARRQHAGNTLGVYWRQVTGLPHKGLRTTFATAADGSEDDAAVDLVMGHVATSVRRRHYVKRFDPGRLRRLTELVWRTCGVRMTLPLPPPLSAGAAARAALARSATPATPTPPTGGSGTGAALPRAAARPGPAPRRP